MQNKSYPKIAILILLLIIGSRSLAQTKVEAQIPAGTNHVYIKDVSQSSVIVEVSYDNMTWKRDTLAPNLVNPYKMLDKFFIKVYTGNKYVEYRLIKGKKYAIEWMEENNKWDMQELVNK